LHKFTSDVISDSISLSADRWGNWLRAKLKTVGQVRRQVQGEALAALVGFCLTALTQGRNAQAIVEQLTSCLKH